MKKTKKMNGCEKDLQKKAEREVYIKIRLSENSEKASLGRCNLEKKKKKNQT